MITRQVLIVTENSELSGPIQEQMRNDATETYCVGSLSEVLRLTAKSEFCLVILDLQLSGIKILEMVRIIRISQQTPILALTDPLESNQEIALYHAGVNALMEKPIKAEVCAAQAESLIQLCLQSDEDKKRQTTLAFGKSLVICPRFWQAFVNGELLELTKKVHINTLRRKLMVLGYNPIENIRGVGYRFIPPN